MINQEFSNSSHARGAKYLLPQLNLSSQDCFLDYVKFEDILNQSGLPKVSFKLNKIEETFSLN